MQGPGFKLPKFPFVTEHTDRWLFVVVISNCSRISISPQLLNRYLSPRHPTFRKPLPSANCFKFQKFWQPSQSRQLYLFAASVDKSNDVLMKGMVLKASEKRGHLVKIVWSNCKWKCRKIQIKVGLDSGTFRRIPGGLASQLPWSDTPGKCWIKNR